MRVLICAAIIPNIPKWHACVSSVCSGQVQVSRSHAGCRLQYDYNKSIAMNLQLVSAADVTNLRCLPIVGVEDASPYLTDVSVDAAYYQFQFCECLPGLEKAPADPVNGLSRIQCKHVWHLNVPGLIGFILGLGCFVAITTWLCLLARRFRRRMGPPGWLPAPSLHAGCDCMSCCMGSKHLCTLLVSICCWSCCSAASSCQRSHWTTPIPLVWYLHCNILVDPAYFAMCKWSMLCNTSYHDMSDLCGAQAKAGL